LFSITKTKRNHNSNRFLLPMNNRIPGSICRLSSALPGSVRWLVILSILVLGPRAWGAFGYTDNGTEYVVDTGAGLAFNVNKSNGNVDSWLYQGVQYNGPSGKGSEIASGLGSGGTSVSAANLGNIVEVIIQTDATNAVCPNLTHYIIVTNGVDNVYMADYMTQEPGVGEFRWITRLAFNLLTNGPVPANNNGSISNVESTDVFYHPNGTTTSKYYGDGITHSKDRAMDLTYCGATGNNAGVWMVFGNRESSSGGPFYRDIENQGDGANSDQEIYNYMNSGHQQTEAYRTSVLYGPYVLVWNNGSAPTLPTDTSWLGTLGLTGWVDASGRGAVSGTASGIPPDIEGVVGLSNIVAQYWAKIDSTGNYTVSGVKAGTYTAILYQGELGVVTNPVTVTAGSTTTLNLTSAWPNPSKVFQIGAWDGTPQCFLNATNILGLSQPNFISMHPSDVRMNTWSNVTFNVGIDPISKFPSILMRGTNGVLTINFPLVSSQITTLTLKIGATTAYNHGRPDVKINGTDLGSPGAANEPTTRGWTVGSYRGYNVLWSWTLPAADLVVGTNQLIITPVSGSADLSAWLSAGWVFDAVELDGPAFVNTNPPPLIANYASGTLSLSWPTNAGWTLQAQTNSLAKGLGTNWTDVYGSTGMTSTNVPVDSTKPTVFYRLRN
jgi:rhamnogalacturonan endolyase